MTRFDQLPFSEKIRWRIRGLQLTLALMLVYMVVVAELGGGDSRMMTRLAGVFTRVVFFGGMGYVIFRIIRNKKLLQNRSALQAQHLHEYDERTQFLHDKTGGFVLDVLLAVMLFVTLTAAQFSMAAFYTALSILVSAIVLKVGTYGYFSRR